MSAKLSLSTVSHRYTTARPTVDKSTDLAMVTVKFDHTDKTIQY